MKVKLLSCVWLFVTPWTVACQAPLSMGFSRQEYSSGLPFPSPGDLLNSGIEPGPPMLKVDAPRKSINKNSHHILIAKTSLKKKKNFYLLEDEKHFFELRRNKQSSPTGGLVLKYLPPNAGDVGSNPGLGRSPGEGNGNPLQYSCLGNTMDRRA